jgi:hypothetical protein
MKNLIILVVTFTVSFVAVFSQTPCVSKIVVGGTETGLSAEIYIRKNVDGSVDYARVERATQTGDHNRAYNETNYDIVNMGTYGELQSDGDLWNIPFDGSSAFAAPIGTTYDLKCPQPATCPPPNDDCEFEDGFAGGKKYTECNGTNCYDCDLVIHPKGSSSLSFTPGVLVNATEVNEVTLSEIIGTE